MAKKKKKKAAKPKPKAVKRKPKARGKKVTLADLSASILELTTRLADVEYSILNAIDTIAPLGTVPAAIDVTPSESDPLTL